ncbi:MAG: SPOR domain-containing protein [Pikeienuella sp.]
MFVNRVSSLVLGFGALALTGCATMSLSETGASSSDRVAVSQTGDYSVLDCTGLLAVADLVKLRLDLARAAGQPTNLLAVQMNQVAKQGTAQNCPRVMQVVADAGNIAAFEGIAFNSGSLPVAETGLAEQPVAVASEPVTQVAAVPNEPIVPQPIAQQPTPAPRAVSTTNAPILLGETIIASTEGEASAILQNSNVQPVSGGKLLQVGTFYDPQNTKAALFYFEAQGFNAQSLAGSASDENLRRVVLGPFATAADLNRAVTAAAEIGLIDSFVVTE